MHKDHRALVIDPEGRFVLHRRPDPVPGPHDVVVEIRAAGLNAADLQQARGDYPAPPGWPPDVPGLEVAGEVCAIGDRVAEVADVALRDRVMALVGGGGHAERVRVPADLVLTIPTDVSWTAAGGFPEIFSTAWDALVDQAALRAGERVLVTGAAGGVGTAMVQVAALCGADVVAAVRRPELHDRAASLAPGRVEVITPAVERDQAPFDVVVELVGGEGCLDRVSRLRTGGRYLIVGVQGGSTATLPMFDLMIARAHVIGTTIRGRSHAEKALLARSMRSHVVPLLEQRRLHVPVDSVYSLDRFGDAFARLAGPGKFGKVVLLMPPS